MPSSSDYVHLDVEEISGETDKAFYVTLEDNEWSGWVPKSQISDVDNYDKGDKNCTISVSEWWAKQVGLSTGD